MSPGFSMHRRKRMSLPRVACCWALLSCATATDARTQVAPIVVGSELDDYLRFLELRGEIVGGPLLFRSFTSRDNLSSQLTGTAHVWGDRIRFVSRSKVLHGVQINVLTPETQAVYNSEYPRSFNDGVLWAGKGLSGTLTAGAQIRWGPVTGTIYPTFHFSQNRDFESVTVRFPTRSEFAYPWTPNIDFPQRFGSDAFAELDWGQTGIRLDLTGFTAGFSTENMWWGPGVRNAIMMSNTAGGFPHVDIGTRYPVSIGIGKLEVRSIWGQLSESDYFDNNPLNNRGYITGLTLGYMPTFLPGLVVGASGVVYEEWPQDGLSFADIFRVLKETANKKFLQRDGSTFPVPRGQFLSFVGRWTFPQIGFETYAEWVRSDLNINLRDFVVAPDHTRGYTLGFQKILESRGGPFRLRGEVTTLGRSRTAGVRASPVYLVDPAVGPGFTHRGQSLGAGIGPAGNSQFVGLDRYTARGRWGVSFQRIRFDDDAFFRRFTRADAFAFDRHDVELTLGVSSYWFVEDFEIGAALYLSRRVNWYFERGNDVTNTNGNITVRWRGR